MINTIKSLTAKGVKFQFIKEALTFTGENNPMANLLLGVMGSLAEWERAVIRDRQLAGIAIAKARGVYKGRKQSLTLQEQAEIRSLALSGVGKTELAENFAVSCQTVYAYLK